MFAVVSLQWNKKNNDIETTSDGILFTMHSQSEQRTHDIIVDFERKIK